MALLHDANNRLLSVSQLHEHRNAKISLITITIQLVLEPKVEMWVKFWIMQNTGLKHGLCTLGEIRK